METKELDHSRYSFLIGQLIRKLNLLNKEQKICYGLTLPQCYAIETLGQEGKLPMSRLSQELGVTVSTLTRVVDVLVRNGVVVRNNSPGDRRKIYIELTEKGKDLDKKLKECSVSYSREILSEIPVKKKEHLLESLELLVRAIDSVKRKCYK